MGKLFKKIQYELVIFLFLVIQLLVIIPSPQEINSWTVTSYFMSYDDFGFGSRFLIGSVFKLLFPKLPTITLYMAILVTLIVLILFVAAVLGSAIRRSGDSMRAVIILAALYLASPASIAHLFGWRNYGRFDIYLIIIAVSSLYLINTKADFLIPVLALVGMAIHQVFIFSYMSIIVFALLYNMYEKGGSKRAIIIAGVTATVAIASFAYFQFLAPPLGYDSPDAVARLLQQRTNMQISKNMIFYEYFASLNDHISSLVLYNFGTRVIKFIMVLILMLPVSILLIYILRNSEKSAPNGRLKLLLHSAIDLPIAMLLPAFALTTDWGRWLAAIYTFQFAIIMYLAYKKCAPVVASLNKVIAFFERNSYLILILIAYLSILGKFEDDNILDLTNRFLVMIQG